LLHQRPKGPCRTTLAKPSGLGKRVSKIRACFRLLPPARRSSRRCRCQVVASWGDDLATPEQVRTKQRPPAVRLGCRRWPRHWSSCRSCGQAGVPRQVQRLTLQSIG
jgi:hypothetical protein